MDVELRVSSPTKHAEPLSRIKVAADPRWSVLIATAINAQPTACGSTPFCQAVSAWRRRHLPPTLPPVLALVGNAVWCYGGIGAYSGRSRRRSCLAAAGVPASCRLHRFAQYPAAVEGPCKLVREHSERRQLRKPV